MEKTYKFLSIKSGKTLIVIDNNKITIKRKGLIALMRYGLKGEKTFLINQISAIQLKKAGFATGYLQFVLAGSFESKGGLADAVNDENSVLFDFGSQNRFAEEIKSYVENYTVSSTSNNSSNLDEIAKLKSLLDNGAITQEEFDNKKKELLR